MSSASSSYKNTQNSQQKQSQQQQQSEKLLKSLNKFTINNHQYYVAMIRKTNGTAFRLSIIDKDTCWASSELQFETIRNEALSGNIDQFRTHLISALSKPNDADYAIEQVIDKNKKNKNNIFQIKILRKAAGMSVLLAHIKLYRPKKRGTNLFYLLDKASKTITHQKQQNGIFAKDNMNFQKKYDEALQRMDEVISVKNKQEQELLGKFVMILNEKKKKIRKLMQEVNRLKGNKNDNSEDMTIDEEIKEFGLNVSEHSDDKYGDSNNKQKKVTLNFTTDDLLDIDDDGLSMAVNDTNDNNAKELSPSFGTNAIGLKPKKKKTLSELHHKRNQDSPLNDNESLIMEEDIEDHNMSNRKKRKREYEEEDFLDPPANKKRKVSHKEERESDESDLSYDFNTSDLT